MNKLLKFDKNKVFEQNWQKNITTETNKFI